MNNIKSTRTPLLSGFLYLFNLKAKGFSRLVNYEIEHNSSKGLGPVDYNLSPNAQTWKLTLERAKLLRKKLLCSFLWMLLFTVLSLAIISLIKRSFPANLNANTLLGILSLICYSVGTIGKLGWKGQSFKGDTIYERLDNVFLWILYGLGTFFGTSAFIVS